MVLFLDGWRYWEHRFYHQVPLLWRLHLVHHSDTDIDITTTERHHPLESLVVGVTLVALVMVLGLPTIGIAVYLLVATVVSLVSHANIDFPERLDRYLRWVVVTPGYHAVHHSDLREETDSNYGSVLTVWDRLFGTYKDPSAAAIPHIGLEYFHRTPDTGLGRVLLQPFVFRRGMDYPARLEQPDISGARGNAALSSIVPRDWQKPLLACILSLALVTFAFRDGAGSMVSVWFRSEPWQCASALTCAGLNPARLGSIVSSTPSSRTIWLQTSTAPRRRGIGGGTGPSSPVDVSNSRMRSSDNPA